METIRRNSISIRDLVKGAVELLNISNNPSGFSFISVLALAFSACFGLGVDKRKRHKGTILNRKRTTKNTSRLRKTTTSTQKSYNKRHPLHRQRNNNHKNIQKKSTRPIRSKRYRRRNTKRSTKKIILKILPSRQ